MKVLLATDGSDAAAEAAVWVRHLSKRNPVDVTVMTVRYGESRYAMHPWYHEWISREQESARSLLQSVQKILGEHCRRIELVDAEGPTVATIVEHAKEADIDLVVMGATGHSAAARWLLGSVSDGVANNVDCSVLVVRPGSSATAAEASLPQKVLVGFDESKASRQAVDELCRLDLDPNTRIALLGVIERPPMIFDNRGETTLGELFPGQKEALTNSALAIASQVAEVVPQTDAEVTIAEHAGEALIRKAARGCFDLVVVGDNGHGFISQWLVGSTTKYVLRHSPCSVWVSRQHHRSTDDSQATKSPAVAEAGVS